MPEALNKFSNVFFDVSNKNQNPRRSSDIGRADSRPRRTFPAPGIARPRTRALAPRARITRAMHAPHTPRAQAPALAQHGADQHCAVQYCTHTHHTRAS